MEDPKPIFDYFRNFLISGFLIHYGIYIFLADKWPVHDFIGPIIGVMGFILYVINGRWGWKHIAENRNLLPKTSRRYLYLIAYYILLAAFLDAVVHFHHSSYVNYL